jgi:hypothetical protein
MERLRLLACLALFASTPAFAGNPPSAPADEAVLNDSGFLHAHPDLRWRGEGQVALDEGRFRDAFEAFLQAARYADKPSQAMVGEMLWTGRGVRVDRPLAYAWMDIAAERGYVPFVTRREQYWALLDAGERSEAVEVGRPLFARYRDEVAKPRTERAMAKARRKVTNSRVGSVSGMRVIIPGPKNSSIAIDGQRYYDDTWWEPSQYWAWQDSIWQDPPAD